MKKLILAVLATTFTVLSFPTFAQSCDRSTQTAKDGSRCGDRAADRKPGGR
jgi:hypothetical protein